MLETLEKQVVDLNAWERLLALGLPTKEWEVFRYVRLNDLYSRTYALAEPATVSLSPQENRLVFVNGRYSEALSSPPKEIVVAPLSKALKTYGSFLKHRLAREESDPFALLNSALAKEGLFIYLPPKSVSRFEILHVMTEQKSPTVAMPRMHIYAGIEAEAKCCIMHDSSNLWVNSFVDIALDERANLTLTTILNENEEHWHLDALRATLKRASCFTSYAVAQGGATTRQDYAVQLLEEGAEASLYGVCRLAERRHHHVNVLMEHKAPHCRSLQNFKNVLSGMARTSFEGKIYVHQAAQKTEAYQMNHNLIMSRHAFANSKPNLEIFADDVKASHGSTVGQIDEEQLFYLQTRGIPYAKAKELLVEGFCQEILSKIEWPHANMR